MTLAGVVKEDLACSGSSLPSHFRMILRCILKKGPSFKRQAPSGKLVKKDLTMVIG